MDIAPIQHGPPWGKFPCGLQGKGHPVQANNSVMNALTQVAVDNPGPTSLIARVMLFFSWVAGSITHRRSMETEIESQKATITELREVMIALLSMIEAGAPPEHMQVQAALAKRALAGGPK